MVQEVINPINPIDPIVDPIDPIDPIDPRKHPEPRKRASNIPSINRIKNAGPGTFDLLTDPVEEVAVAAQLRGLSDDELEDERTGTYIYPTTVEQEKAHRRVRRLIKAEQQRRGGGPRERGGPRVR